MAFRLSRAPLTAFLLAVALSACSSDKEDVPYVERPADQIFADGEAAMKAEDYKNAAKLFDEVERQHPYSEWAAKAQLRAAYALYESMKYDDAILALDRFIQLHPGNPNVAYAYYMRGLCFYEQITDVRRDQRMTRNALEAMAEVVRRFPGTPYARDARIKIDLANDHLAGKEMEVGRFYMKQNQYPAALNRFRAVVETYQTTSHVPEALHRLVESYLVLGINDEAQAAAAVLGYNFPGSVWYEDSYSLLAEHNLSPKGNEKSWLNKAWKSVF